MNPDDNKFKPQGQPAQPAKAVADKAASVTKDAIQTAQKSADRVADKVSDSVDQARSQVKPVVDKASDAVSSAVDKGRTAFHDAADQLRSQAQKASDAATGYAKDEPMKALLVAAAAGAVLMALVAMMGRSRD